MKRIFFIICLFFSSIDLYCQQLCLDTIKRNILFLNNDSSILVEKVYLLEDGSHLLLGTVHKKGTSQEDQSSCIVKTNEKNEVLWSKVLSYSNSGLYFRNLVVFNNGTICIEASTKSSASTGTWLFFISNNGVLLDSKVLQFDVPNKIITNVKFSVSENFIFLCVVFDSYNIPSGGTEDWIALAKLDYLGNSLWSTSYITENSVYIQDMICKHNQLFIMLGGGVQLLRFDCNNGLLIKSAFFLYPDQPSNTGLAYPTASRLFTNNSPEFTAFTFRYYGYDTVRILLKFDTLLNVSISKYISFKGNSSQFNINDASVSSNGTILLSAINYAESSKRIVAGISDKFEFIEQKVINYNSITIPSLWTSYNVVPILKSNLFQLYNNSNVAGKFQTEIAESPLSTLSNSCGGYLIDSLQIKDFALINGRSHISFKRSNILNSRSSRFSILDLVVLSKISCISIIERKVKFTSDTAICKGDTVTLKANAGFIKYNWPVTYNFKQLTDSTANVFPQKDTFYVVQTFTASGCMLSDTVFVTVNQPEAINIGKDTSICKGDSLVLHVSNNFLTYNWSTGQKNPTIIVNQPATYWVNALNSNGCYSVDTIKLVSLYNTPTVAFTNPAVLCINQTDTLDAGIFATYLWQNGSAERYLKVTSPGNYTVTVADSNTCKSSGSIYIDSVVLPPKNFLQNDTAICNYQTMTISALPNYSSYLWSTGSTSKAITIQQPGKYFLNVIDSLGCYGIDTVTVSLKSCANSIYFPTAFTPDNNGLNDTYKPIIEGRLLTYKLSIYNRWGVEVFSTTNPTMSWDGKYKNIVQPPGIFTWQCSFQFASESVQMSKGIVTIIQ